MSKKNRTATPCDRAWTPTVLAYRMADINSLGGVYKWDVPEHLSICV
ncbi:hypothetical protein AB0L75_24960 [Streptomyces sp. NPDC052101]